MLIAADRREEKKHRACKLCSSAALPGSLRVQPWMQLDVGSAGWALGRRDALLWDLLVWLCLFCILPDVLFSLLCLFSSAFPLACPQERLLWLIDLMEVGAAGGVEL